jgi:RNase P/RNase MRP subunit p30
VDIVFFDTTNRNVRFTHSLARVLHGALELNFSDLMNQPEGWAFTKVRKAIAIAREHGVKVVLSSGARTPLMVRTPSELSALATTLGMKQDESTIAVSSLPLSIVATNVKKRAPEYVEEGVTIVVPTRRK